MQYNFSKTEKKPAAPSAAVKALLLLFETALALLLGLLCAALLILHGPSERSRARLAARFPLFSSFSSDADGEAPRGVSGAAGGEDPKDSSAENQSDAAGEDFSSGAAGEAPKGSSAENQSDAAGEDFSSAAAGEDPRGVSGAAGGEDLNDVSENGDDGVLLTPVYGRGYAGYLVTVTDPGRVIVGCVPASLGGRGFSVEELCQRFGAVAGINAGGFLDEGGTGNGATPDSLLVYEGKSYFGGFGTGRTFVGLDADHRLVVGQPSRAEIEESGIRYGVCFGPALLVDGEITEEAAAPSNVNPRSAIGQRADGAILLLVIDGRHALSMGATIRDMAEILQRNGAVTGCNLDGGTSSVLWYEGSYRNTLPLLYFPRPVPDAFLVLAKEG